MSNVVPFKKPPVKKRGLCQYGHHKWRVVKNSQFDTRQGRLVTIYRCGNCGKQKIKAH